MSAAKSNTLRRLVRRWWGNLTGARTLQYVSLKAARCDRVLERIESDCDEWVGRLPPGGERRAWLMIQFQVRMMRTRNSWATPNASHERQEPRQ
jgi:hypothetical protein